MNQISSSIIRMYNRANYRRFVAEVIIDFMSNVIDHELSQIFSNVTGSLVL